MNELAIKELMRSKEEKRILDYNIKFLDVQAKKDRQFGFRTILENGKALVFLGDETFDEKLRDEMKVLGYQRVKRWTEKEFAERLIQFN